MALNVNDVGGGSSKAEINALAQRVTTLENRPFYHKYVLNTDQVIGTWVDGRTIYERTICPTSGTGAITLGNYPTTSNSYIEYSHNIPNLKMVVACFGLWYKLDGTASGFFPYSDLQYTLEISSVRSDKINFAVSGNWTGYGLYMFIQYVKSS